MKAAGLAITGVVVYNAENDPNHLLGRQNGYSSKDAWVVSAAVTAGAGSPSDDPGGIQYGGGVEVFPSLAGAQSRLTELKGFRAPIGDGYDYRRDGGPAPVELPHARPGGSVSHGLRGRRARLRGSTSAPRSTAARLHAK